MQESIEELEAHCHDQDARRLAVAMATHSRLGCNGLLGRIDSELLQTCMPPRSPWLYSRVPHDVFSGRFPLYVPECEFRFDTFGQSNAGGVGCFYRVSLCHAGEVYRMFTDELSDTATTNGASAVYFGPPHETERVVLILTWNDSVSIELHTGEYFWNSVGRVAFNVDSEWPLVAKHVWYPRDGQRTFCLGVLQVEMWKK